MAETLTARNIRTLYAGVSRQPTPIRRKEQVEEGINALFSVVTGGFEKRPSSQVLAQLLGASTSLEYAVHVIDRDAVEQYVILFADEVVLAYNALDGAQQTINILDQDHWFYIDETAIDSVGPRADEEVAWDSSETTFDWDWKLSDPATVFDIEGSADGTVWNVIATGLTGATGTTSTTIGAVVPNDHKFIRANITTAATGALDTLTLYATYKDLSYLIGATPETIAFTTVADFTFVVNREVRPLMRELGTGTIAGSVQQFSNLPAASGGGAVYEVIGDDTDNFASFFVQDVTVNGSNVWQETVDPTGANDIDPTFMPHQLVRTASGDWEFGQAEWQPRKVGNEDSVPDPSFINNKVRDIIFHRGRMAFLANEQVSYSKTDEALNFWPDKAFNVLDTDPIERSASGSSVSFLQWANAFRKTLFATAELSQFELTAPNAFTPQTAVMDLATSYRASPNAKPKTLGDVLYFPSTNPRNSLVYEYFFDDSTVSSTAVDVTRHVVDYIPLEILQMATDPATGSVFVLSSGANNEVFVYRTFWDGTDKVQSSWSRWTFGVDEADAFIHGIAVLSGFLILVIERADGNIYLEQVSLEEEAIDPILGFLPLMDQRDVATGVYDSGTDLTTWTFPWGHQDDAIVVLGPNFADAGRQLDLEYPTSTTATTQGDFGTEECYVGRPYGMAVTLSEMFMRDGNDTPIYTGRLQLKHIILAYQDTGFIEAEVKAEDRSPKSFKYTGRRISGSSNVIGGAAIDKKGRFRFPVNSKAETVTITIKNDTIFPSVITGLTWVGHYSDKTEG